MSAFVNWHKKYIGWWQKQLRLSDYAIMWIAFLKGVIIGALLYWLLR